MTDTTHHNSGLQGFSMIELLIALACVGILLTWGWPQYLAYVQRSQRAQARVTLLQMAHWMERSASANGSYPLTHPLPANIGAPSDLRYRIQVNSSANTYLLMAIPTGAQGSDPCGTLTLNHLGVRAAQNVNETSRAHSCWQQ